MKPVAIGSWIAVVLVVGVLAVAWFALGMPESMALHRRFDELVRTNDHQAVLAAAMGVIEATTNDMTFMDAFDYPSITNLPPAIRTMQPRSIGVSPDHMIIEFHGGSAHFGFEIWKRETQWSMGWYTEDERHELATAPRTGE